MAKYQLNVNSQSRDVTVDPSTPLLWVLREELRMTGTKYGCGISACGACTVHVGGAATRSCVLPVSAVGPPPALPNQGNRREPPGRLGRDGGGGRGVAQGGDLPSAHCHNPRPPPHTPPPPPDPRH